MLKVNKCEVVIKGQFEDVLAETAVLFGALIRRYGEEKALKMIYAGIAAALKMEGENIWKS